MSLLTLGVVLGAAAAVGADDAGSASEKVLYAGPVGRTVPTYSLVRRPYRPWKIDWEHYLYRDFYSCIRDEQLPDRPKDGPPADARFGAHGTVGAAVQSANLVHLRFFGDEKLQVPGHPKFCPAGGDWRGYQLIRMDMKFSTDTHVWWALEDKAVQPPVTGNFDVKAGRWTTLQIDLEEAAKARGLNLAEMWLMWVRTNATPGTRVEMKKIRLAGRTTKAEYPVLDDPNAAKLPSHPPTEAPPAPDVRRHAAPLEGPRTITYRSATRIGLRGIYRQQYGFAAAYDAQRMLLVLTDGSFNYVDRRTGRPVPRRGEADRWEGFAVQTLDGGKTWRGLDADKDRTWLYLNVGQQFEVIDANGSAIVTNENGCGNNPGPRQRLTRFTFLGKAGWTCNRKDYVLNEESRHCSHGGHWFDATRIASGRIWAAIYVETRLWPNCQSIHAKYSDNDGSSWHTWKEGLIARIPGADVRSEGSNPQIVPYGEHVAVLWTNHVMKPTGSKWTYFDGKAWSKPQPVAGYLEWAVATGPKEIVAYTWVWKDQAGKPTPPGLWRLAGDKWVFEPGPTVGAHTQVSLSGKSIMWLNARGDKIRLVRRSHDGKRHAQDYPVEGRVLSWTVPRYSPPNFTPVLYMTDRSETEAKVLLVPNPDTIRGNPS